MKGDLCPWCGYWKPDDRPVCRLHEDVERLLAAVYDHFDSRKAKK